MTFALVSGLAVLKCTKIGFFSFNILAAILFISAILAVKYI